MAETNKLADTKESTDELSPAEARSDLAETQGSNLTVAGNASETQGSIEVSSPKACGVGALRKRSSASNLQGSLGSQVSPRKTNLVSPGKSIRGASGSAPIPIPRPSSNEGAGWRPSVEMWTPREYIHGTSSYDASQSSSEPSLKEHEDPLGLTAIAKKLEAIFLDQSNWSDSTSSGSCLTPSSLSSPASNRSSDDGEGPNAALIRGTLAQIAKLIVQLTKGYFNELVVMISLTNENIPPVDGLLEKLSEHCAILKDLPEVSSLPLPIGENFFPLMIEKISALENEILPTYESLKSGHQTAIFSAGEEGLRLISQPVSEFLEESIHPIFELCQRFKSANFRHFMKD